MSPTVLVVDDDVDIRHTIVELLADEGYLILEASDGAEALTVALARNPDAIVMDHLMPSRTGADVVRALREHGSKIPIVLMTAGKDPLARDANAEAFLRKPFALDELLEALRSALEPR